MPTLKGISSVWFESGDRWLRGRTGGWVHINVLVLPIPPFSSSRQSYYYTIPRISRQALQTLHQTTQTPTTNHHTHTKPRNTQTMCHTTTFSCPTCATPSVPAKTTLCARSPLSHTNSKSTSTNHNNVLVHAGFCPYFESREAKLVCEACAGKGGKGGKKEEGGCCVLM